jgi:hypothetical protein
MDIEEKRKFLRENGWEMSWSDDNWVRSDAANKEANAGISTAAAYALMFPVDKKIPEANPNDLELYRFRRVNACETTEELKACIIDFADDEGMIQGRARKFNATKMSAMVNMFMTDIVPGNVLTREYGIRQQALYLKQFVSE